MFLIPTTIGPSPIHGLGVFTAVPIPAGTVIWEFRPEVDLVIPVHLVEAMPEDRGRLLRSYAYLQEPGQLVLCGDNARFMNHSNEPNCDDPDPQRTVAARDIAAGEELTSDYGRFEGDTSPHGLDASIA